MKEIIVLIVLNLHLDWTYKFQNTIGAFNDDASCLQQLENFAKMNSNIENVEVTRDYDYFTLRINDKPKKTIKIYNCQPTTYFYRDLK